MEGPFEIPESWEWVRLGDISNYGQCENVDVSRISLESWTLELEDIEKDTAKIIAFQNIKKRPLKGVRHRFLAGDVLYSKLRTYLNKVLVAPKDGYCTTEIIPIKSYSGISSNYMCYVLRSNYYLDYTSSLGFGVKMPRLSTNDAIKSLIPIPPYNEQIRIVKAIQDACDTLERIESAQENVTRQISLIKSKILSLAISGDLVPQDPNDEPAIELLKRINQDFKPCDNSHYPFEIPDSWVFASGKDIFLPMKSTKPSGNEFFYIDIDSVDNKNNVIHSPKRVKTENAPSRASRFTKKGDVVFSMVRPYLRNIAAVRENGCIASTGFFVCSPNKSIHTDYMFLMMLSSYVIDGLNQFMKGDNSPSINTDNILSWKYPVPPLNEQRRIVVEVQRLYQCLEQIETHLTK